MGGYWIIGRGPLDPVSKGQEKYLFFPIVELFFLDWIGIQEKKRNHLQDLFIFMFVGVDAWILVVLWIVMICGRRFVSSLSVSL